MSDEFSIKPIVSPDAIINPELRQRVETLKVPSSEEHIAITSDGAEAGFLSVEDFESQDFSLIQTIFVLPTFRNLGLGNALLSFAEILAIEKGYPLVWLRPRSLDPAIDEEFLVQWYERKGYEMSDDGDHMEKVL